MNAWRRSSGTGYFRVTFFSVTVNVIYFCDGSEVSSVIIHVVQLNFMSFDIVRKKYQTASV